MKVIDKIKKLTEPVLAEPLVSWRGLVKSGSSVVTPIEFTILNLALAQAKGQERVMLMVDLLQLWVDSRRIEEAKRAFGSSYETASLVQLYTVNNFGGEYGSLHVSLSKNVYGVEEGDVGFSVVWRGSLQHDRHMTPIYQFHLAILAALPWVDRTRFDDNRQQDNIRYEHRARYYNENRPRGRKHLTPL